MKTLFIFFICVFIGYSLNAQQSKTLKKSKVEVESGANLRMYKTVENAPSNFVSKYKKTRSQKPIYNNRSKSTGNLINETFDTFLPVGWLLSDPNGYWMSEENAFDNANSTPIAKQDGDTYYAAFDSYNGDNTTNTYSLITPRLIPNVANHTLSYDVTMFLLGSAYISSGPKMYVEISTDNGLTWTNSTTNVLTQITGYNTTLGNNVTVTVNLDLNTYVDQIIRVRFRTKSDWGGFIVALDNVTGVPLYVFDEPELGISNISSSLPLTIVPLHHAGTITPHASIINLGANMTSTSTLNFSVTPGTYSQDVTIPEITSFSAQADLSIEQGNEYTPTSIGDYKLIANITSTDSDPTNNKDTINFSVTYNTFAQDNGNLVSYIGSGIGAITFGNMYELKTSDYIKSFSIAFGEISSLQFKVRIYSVSESNNATLVYESENFNRNTASDIYTFKEFAITPQHLEAGRYLFCVYQTSATSIKCATDNVIVNGHVYIVQSNGTINSGRGNAAIRVNTAQYSSYTPSANATNVEIDAPVTVTFSQNMTAATINDITISGATGITASINNNILTIAHDNFAFDTEYTVTVPTTAITGLTDQISWTFRTKLDPNACNVPTNFASSDLTYSSIKLNWDENGPAIKWNIEYGPTGFAHDEGTLLSQVEENPYTITALTAQTAYDVYVQSYCSDSDQSGWVGPISFTTPANCDDAISTFPYTEDFEDASRLACWENIRINGTRDWTLATGSGTTTDDIQNAHSGTKNYLLKGTTRGNISRLIMPKLDISGITHPVLEFWHAQKLWVSDQDILKIYYKNSAEGEWVKIFEKTTNVSTWTMETIGLPNASDDYYIAFEGTINYGYGIILDDVSVHNYTGTTIDAGITAITQPSTGENLSATEDVIVTIKNFGASITGFDLKLYVNDVNIATETYTQTIPALQSANYTFAATADLSTALETYQVKVVVDLTDDENATNNEMIKSVTNLGNLIIMGESASEIGCNSRFFDDGGFGYYIDEVSTQTITLVPENAGEKIKVDFTELDIAPYFYDSYWDEEYFGDTLFVYEGSTQNVNNLLGFYSGDYSDNLPSITSYSSDGALTFVFKKAGDDYASGWIANVSCITIPDSDAGMVSIISPITTTSATSNVSVKIRNLGVDPITSMDLAYKLNDETPVVETYNGNIASGEYLTYTFTNGIELSESGFYTLNAYTNLTGDVDNTNDSKTIYFAYQPELTLYGYRIYDDVYDQAQTNPRAIVSFNTSAPETVTIVNEYRDGTNSIRAGEYLNKELYLFSSTSSGTAKNFIQLLTTDWTQSSSTTISSYPSDMAYDYSTNTMYAIKYVSETLSDLKTVNMETGVMTDIGSLGRNFVALACNLDGQLYGVSYNGTFCSINKSNAAVTEIGNTGISPEYIQCMAFDHNSGRLLWAMCNADDEGKLIEIDPATGKSYDWGTIGANAEIVSLYTPYEVLMVDALSPVNNATGVALNAEVSVTFNMNITANDLTGITINGNAATASVSDNKLTINHDEFAYFTQYTINIPANAITGYTQAISWTFKTMNNPNIPAVQTLAPANNSTNVALNSEVSVTFNMNITANDLTGITINGNAATASINGNKLTINHDDFAYLTQYTINIPANAITYYDQVISWTFKTMNDVNVPMVYGNEINIYPNPSNGEVNISVSENSLIKVVDITGRIIDSYSINANSTLNFNQAKGVYFILVENNGKVSTHKLVIQ